MLLFMLNLCCDFLKATVNLMVIKRSVLPASPAFIHSNEETGERLRDIRRQQEKGKGNTTNGREFILICLISVSLTLKHCNRKEKQLNESRRMRRKPESQEEEAMFSVQPVAVAGK